MTENPKTCQKCGSPVAPGIKFCESCGAKIEALPSCPKCGAALAPGVKFCESCGAPIGPAAPAEAVKVAAPVAPVAEMSTPPAPPVPETPPVVEPKPATEPVVKMEEPVKTEAKAVPSPEEKPAHLHPVKAEEKTAPAPAPVKELPKTEKSKRSAKGDRPEKTDVKDDDDHCRDHCPCPAGCCSIFRGAAHAFRIRHTGTEPAGISGRNKFRHAVSNGWQQPGRVRLAHRRPDSGAPQATSLSSLMSRRMRSPAILS